MAENDKFRIPFASRVRLRIQELGLSQRKAADRAGIPYSVLVSWLRTKGFIPKADKLPVLAKALNTSIDYLLGLTSNPTPTRQLERLLADIPE